MKCPQCRYENAQGVLVCNSCATILPQVQIFPAPQVSPPQVSLPAGMLPNRFSVRLGFLGLQVGSATIEHAGQRLFRVAPRRRFLGYGGLDFLPQDRSVSNAAFTVRRLPFRLRSFTQEQSVEDLQGNRIGLIRLSPVSWSARLALETPAGLKATARPSYLRFLTFLLVFVPVVGHFARMLSELLLTFRGTTRFYADGQPVVTFRRHLTRLQVVIYLSPEKLDPRLPMAAALSFFWLG